MPTTTTHHPTSERLPRTTTHRRDRRRRRRSTPAERAARAEQVMADVRRAAGPWAFFWLPASAWTRHVPRPPERG
ncbi:hypothetical protein [Salsipaludibacter albus]|uniref:hypothetical protein n=1 Tax=Salsipaludibacter albus TaxID=2849650 RepID=UPI001EE3D8F2|nr:hypothetical protein [Salsipaludibacter albus]MBY5163404.1 hypothetical protein [Salsipaludibacter albus]